MKRNKTLPSSPTLLTGAGVACMLLAAGCGDEDSANGNGGGERPDSAILIAERFNTPEGRVGYAGVFEELPDEPIETNQLFELPSTGKVFGCGDNVFQYDGDSSTITKYLVGDNLSLTEHQKLIVSTEGVEGFSAAMVCASPTRAYIFSRDATRGVEWNPETMVIVDAFDLPAPELDEGVDPAIFEPVVAGDLVYFPMEALEWETFKYNTQAIVAVFDLTDESWTYDYYDGCSSTTGGYIADDGTVYIEPTYQFFYATYTEQEEIVPQCLLRIPAGSKEFDDSYSVDVGDIRNTYPIDGDYLLATRVDPSAAVPPRDDPWGWFGLDIVPTRIERATGAEQPYPGLTSSPPENVRRITLDGRELYQLQDYSEEGTTVRTNVVELHPDGASDPVFVVEGGDVLTLERLW